MATAMLTMVMFDYFYDYDVANDGAVHGDDDNGGDDAADDALWKWQRQHRRLRHR